MISSFWKALADITQPIAHMFKTRSSATAEGPRDEHLYHTVSYILYVKFGGPTCIGFWDIVRKNTHTHRQTVVKTLPPWQP